MKVCRCCGAKKPLASFHLQADSRDGHRNNCAECGRAAAKASRAANLEHHRAIGIASYRRNRDKRIAANKEWCKANPDKRRQHRQASNARHPDRVAARHRAYMKAHPGLNASYTAMWREKNRDRHRAMIAAWSKINVEKRQANAAKRRTLLSGGVVTASQWLAIKAAHGHSCIYCGTSDTLLTMDHVVAIARGGAHDPSNIVPACIPCNSSKKAREVNEWLAWKYLR